MKVAFSIYLEEEVVRWLDAQAGLKGVSRSWITQRVLEAASGVSPANFREVKGETGKNGGGERVSREVRHPRGPDSEGLGRIREQAVRSPQAAVPGPDMGSGGDAEAVEPCTYTEYDQETGELYRCRLPKHSPKIKHQRGPAL